MYKRKRITKKRRKIELLSEESTRLSCDVAMLTFLLEKLIENQSIDKSLKYNIDYVAISNKYSKISRREIVDYLFKIVSQARDTNKYPTLEEFHQGLLDILNIPQEKRDNYPYQISIGMLEDVSLEPYTLEMLELYRNEWDRSK